MAPRLSATSLPARGLRVAIEEDLAAWIIAQAVLYLASAPLDAEGSINRSL
jgi:hypothetical protein